MHKVDTSGHLGLQGVGQEASCVVGRLREHGRVVDVSARLVNVLVHQVVGLIDLSVGQVLVEVYMVRAVFFRGFASHCLHQRQRLGGQQPVVLRCVLIALLGNRVIRQELDDAKGKVWTACLLVGLLGLIELVICAEPVGIWKIDHWLHFWVLLGKHEGFLPLFTLNVQFHQLL
jgi:hypothetical protein